VPGVPVPTVTTDNAVAAGALVDSLGTAARAQGRPLAWLWNAFLPEVNAVERERHRGAVEAARRWGLTLVDRPGAGPGARVSSSAEGHCGVRAGDWAGVFDAWPGEVGPLAGVRVAVQDFRTMGEGAADVLLALLEGRPAPPVTLVPALGILPPGTPTGWDSTPSSS